MTIDNALKSAVGFFVLIVGGSIASAALGGIFAAIVAAISPEFVTSLFGDDAGERVTAYSVVVGMLWGLFIGAGASAFACGLAAIIKMLRIRLEYKKGQAEHAG
jgi:hypothetical protein